MSVDQILHVFFLKSRQYFRPFWQINITELPFICANLSNSWYVNTKSRAWCLWIKSFTFFSLKSRKYFCLVWQINITELPFPLLFLFVPISVIRDTQIQRVGLGRCLWIKSFTLSFFFLPRRGKIQNGREKMMTRYNKI